MRTDIKRECRFAFQKNNYHLSKVKVKVNLSVQVMKTYEGVKVQLHSFVTLALYGGQWPASYSNRFITGKRPQNPLQIRLGRLHTGLDALEKIYYVN